MVKTRDGNEFTKWDAQESFHSIDACPVDDISIDFFYKPHTITLLVVSIGILLYCALHRDQSSLENNICSGFCGVVFFIVIISVLAFPNGPFTRPHPAFWRIVFGLNVLYLLCLQFTLFQNLDSVKSFINLLYPELKKFKVDMEKEYATKCWNITLEEINEKLDGYAVSHFIGWALKALLFRHYGILWTASILWEITEVVFVHLIPRLAECWWDSLVLDILLCNGTGIWFGIWICKKLEMRTYKWESMKMIQTTTGKLRRAVLQFTPGSWTLVNWSDHTCTFKRCFSISVLLSIWQLAEINSFFIPHILVVPNDHPLLLARVILFIFICAPVARQMYFYITDKRCKRLGNQTWIFLATIFTEIIICIKFRPDLFARAQIANIIAWSITSYLLTVICIYICIYHTNDEMVKPDKSKHGIWKINTNQEASSWE